jgi:hypothetical protein
MEKAKRGRKHKNQHSHSLGSMICPECQRVGNLKVRTDWNNVRAFVVDHWKIGNNHKSGHDGSCYIGTATLQLAKQLFEVHPDTRILEWAKQGT